MHKLKYIDKVKQPLIKPCPGAQGYYCCNYVVVSQILNCPYNCSYCFLQTFFGKDEIVVVKDEEEIVRQVKAYLEVSDKPLRVGTGEYSDSLALPDAVSLAKKLVELFAGQKEHLLELKTKSTNIEDFLSLPHNSRTVMAWSVNPEKIVQSDEFGANSLAERLVAASKCVKAGYPVAFHFDPIIYFPGWEKDYEEVVGLIFASIPADMIAWISLGALRFPARQLKKMQQNAGTSICFEYFEKGADTKLRYPAILRIEMFKKMNEFIRSHSQNVYVYLCMESPEVWEGSEIVNNPANPYAANFDFAILSSSR